MHDIVFSMNILLVVMNVFVQGVLRLAPPLRRAAICDVRTLLPGPEGVRS